MSPTLTKELMRAIVEAHDRNSVSHKLSVEELHKALMGWSSLDLDRFERLANAWLECHYPSETVRPMLSKYLDPKGQFWGFGKNPESGDQTGAIRFIDHDLRSALMLGNQQAVDPRLIVMTSVFKTDADNQRRQKD